MMQRRRFSTLLVLMLCMYSYISIVVAQGLPSCTTFTPSYQMQSITTNCNIPEISANQANNSYISYCSNNSKAACSECF